MGNPAACLIGGNVLFMNGDEGDYIHRGAATIVNAASLAQLDAAPPTTIQLDVTPEDSSQGLWWNLELSSRQLGQPLAVGVYEDAQRSPFADAGHPGIDIGGDGRGCNTITGKFEVHELAFDEAGALDAFTATFEQHCEGGPSALHGCVHFEAP